MTPIAQATVGQRIAAPKTPNELAALIERRDELQDQLEHLSESRAELANQIERLGSSPELRAGPMARLLEADRDIARMSAELKTSNELITAAKASGISDDAADPGVVRVPRIDFGNFGGFGAAAPPRSWEDRLVDSLGTTLPITGATVILLGAFLYWRISRTMKAQFSQLLSAQNGRLEELQRSIDTVAVEVERVSENQRFVTKMVGEKAPGQSVERR